MQNSLITIFLTAVFITVHGQLSWKDLTRQDFTNDHNSEILTANGIDSQQILNEIVKNGKRRGIAESETIFTLHTRQASDGVQVTLDDGASLTHGGFSPSKPIVFVTHGFFSSPDSSWVIDMKNAQLSVSDCNFFTIDWSACAKDLFYPTAADCVPIVGNYLSEMIKFLQSKGASAKNIHLIGHSLGAHVMAQVSLHGLNVARITGLDPAGPLFSEADTDGRIDPTDADFVDIIHTSKGVLSYEHPTGMWDFYPNGGHNQPGCLLETCEHSMSHDFYIETILNNRVYPAVKCESLEAAGKGNCDGAESYMGVLGTEGSTGIYYAKITSKPLKKHP